MSFCQGCADWCEEANRLHEQVAQLRAERDALRAVAVAAHELLDAEGTPSNDGGLRHWQAAAQLRAALTRVGVSSAISRDHWFRAASADTEAKPTPTTTPGAPALAEQP